MMKSKQKGFTLLEVLLVLAIMSVIISIAIEYFQQKSSEFRRDKISMQMQQILNAGLVYYVNNSSWPTALTDLQSPANYLPSGTITNPWGTTYTVGSNALTGTFSVTTTLPTAIEAQILAGRLPMSATGATCDATTASCTGACAAGSSSCALLASVSIPGQNINNARSVNYINLYRNGACVPAPSCPTTSMTPQIMVVPVQVSGTDSSSPTPSLYPISSFSAYYTGAVVGGPPVAANSVLDCGGGAPPGCDAGATGGISGSKTYWRVCLQVVTEFGLVQYTSSSYSQSAVLAITRCLPNNETGNQIGSDFTVFRPDA